MVVESILAAAAAAAGVSVFNASGDSGSTCLNGSPNTIGVPAGSPHAIAVGGTSQITGPTAVYQSETWWNGLTNTPPTGQGGFGVSRFFARPAYQDGFTSSPMRSIPDVVFNSDPAQGTIICQASAGGCPAPFFVGGTSMAAPAWAAATAILNQAQGRNLGNLNLSLYPLANTNAFHSASSIGSDFAHVGLGSPNLNKLHLALTSSTAGAVSATESNMRIVGSTAPADGVSTSFVVVRLRDSAGNAVSGKTVTLTANPGSHAIISPASGISTVDNGAVVFTLTNSFFEEITVTATDTTDGIVLAQTEKIAFVPPPAASASISASPTSIPPNGTSTSTITVTLKDALNRPSPLKEIRLSQGSGHSLITGPDPAVTDANGQIQFVATNGVSETVVYTAVDVTDGDLPVPGSATVDFTGTPTSCVVAPPAAANGFALTSFANGFAARNFFFGNVNWGGCPGASNPAFDTAGSVFVADFPDGVLFRMGIQGGLATNANQIANLGPTLGQPVFGKDGSLYLSRSVTTGSSSSGDIVQVDPANGSIIRTVVSGLTCPAGLSVDPLSGDLFFGNQCFGASIENASLYRVRNPASASPTLEVYATLPATPNGAISFAPDGTLYVVSGYLDPNAPVLRIGGTNTTPTITQTGVTSSYWVTVGEAQANGAAKSLVVLSGGAANPTLSLVDLTTNPVTSTPLINGGIGSGVIGPDGCLYVSASDTIYKLAPSTGGCGFAVTNPSPALVLSPATVSPNPAQGSQQTMTAQFVNASVPANSPVFFNISGANSQNQLARTDANGKATFSYTGTFAGTDTVVASANVGASNFISNSARLNWGAGKHATFLSLNTSPENSTVGAPVTLVAGLYDVSASPATAIAGATIQFAVGGQSCSGTTNASGVASCSVTLPAAGSFTLTASYAGTAQFVPATAARSFFVVAPGVTPPPCFTGTLSGGGQATACLPPGVPPACQLVNPAFVPVASIGVALPAGIQIPYDLFQFTATGCGNSVSLSLTYPAALPANASYWKFGPTAGQPAHWYALPATVNGNTLTVTLTDGGAGDSDLQANGSIVDPGGAGYAVADIPTIDERWLAVLALLVASLGAAVLRQRRSREG